MRDRYQVSVSIAGNTHTFPAKTYSDMATSINNCVGYDLVSKVIVINWLSRGKKSPRYNFIAITPVAY